MRGAATSHAGRPETVGLAAWVARCMALYGLPGVVPRIVVAPGAGLAEVCGGQLRVAPALAEAFVAGSANAAMVLAHEAAHLVQAARPAAPASSLACEAEAGWAAAGAMVGRACPVRLGLPAGRVQHWGLVGHYYTVYFMSLFTGATADEAARMALYTQLPDLVAELDAVKCALDYYFLDSRQKQIQSYKKAVETAIAEGVVEVTGKVLQGAVIASSFSNPRGLPLTYALKAADAIGHGTRKLTGLLEEEGTNHMIAVLQAERQMEIDLAVQRGLHALTGRPAGDERGYRMGLLMQLPWGSREFGLALHAFGDSYAHTDLGGTGKMYAPGVGHAVDLHAPDVVSKHAGTYREYCGMLYDVLNARTPRKLMARADALDFCEAIIKLGVAVESRAEAANRSLFVEQLAHGAFPLLVPMPKRQFLDGESVEQAQQIAMIKALVAKAPFNAPIRYDPVDEAVPWVEFRHSIRPRPRIWPAPDELGWMLAMGLRWAGDGA